MPTVTSMVYTGSSHSLTELIGELKSILFWVEKERYTYASTETPAWWPKKGINIKTWKKIQLFWFLANLLAMTKTIRSQEICGGGKTAGGLQHLKQGPNQGTEELRALGTDISFYWWKCSASVAWHHITKWWVSTSLSLLQCYCKWENKQGFGGRDGEAQVEESS